MQYRPDASPASRVSSITKRPSSWSRTDWMKPFSSTTTSGRQRRNTSRSSWLPITAYTGIGNARTSAEKAVYAGASPRSAMSPVTTQNAASACSDKMSFTQALRRSYGSRPRSFSPGLRRWVSVKCNNFPARPQQPTEAMVRDTRGDS